MIFCNGVMPIDKSSTYKSIKFCLIENVMFLCNRVAQFRQLISPRSRIWWINYKMKIRCEIQLIIETIQLTYIAVRSAESKIVNHFEFQVHVSRR